MHFLKLLKVSLKVSLIVVVSFFLSGRCASMQVNDVSQKKKIALFKDLGEIHSKSREIFGVDFWVTDEDLVEICMNIIPWIRGDWGRMFVYSPPELKDESTRKKVKEALQKIICDKCYNFENIILREESEGRITLNIENPSNQKPKAK